MKITKQNIFKTISYMIIFYTTISSLFSQSPGCYYSYDDAGNRVGRTYKPVFLKHGDTTMIQSVVENYTVKIFPNPVKNYLQVDIQGLSKENNINIQLLDLQGSVIFNWELIKSQFQIETKDLIAGTYFLNIFIDNKRSFWKIIKEY